MAGSVLMRFEADFGEDLVDLFRARVGRCLEVSGVAPAKARILITVLDELVCNILEHSQAGWIELEMRPGPEVWLALRDDGREFDAAGAMRFKGPNTPGENDGERSLGLFMVGGLASACRYRRLDGKVNELKFKVELGKL